MIDKKMFGHQGVFSDRSTLGEAFAYLNEVLETTSGGPDKVALMTAGFIVSNSLARITTHLANVVEQNMSRSIKFVDGKRVDSLLLSEFLDKYEFPFESVLLQEVLREVLVGKADINAFVVLSKIDPILRTYFLMALPKEGSYAAVETDIQRTSPPASE